VESI